jgi:hypothetical protein
MRRTTSLLLAGSLLVGAGAMLMQPMFATGGTFTGTISGGSSGGSSSSGSAVTFTSTQTDGGAAFVAPTGQRVCLNGAACTQYVQSDGGSIGLVGAEVDVPNGFTDSQKVNPDTIITPASVVAQAASGQRAFGVAQTGARIYFDVAGNIYCYSNGSNIVCAASLDVPSMQTNTIGALTPSRDRVEIFYPQPYPLGSLSTCDSDHKGVLKTLTTDGNTYQCNGTDNRGLLRYLRGTASLNYASIAAGADETLTLTVTGAATTDEVHCSALVSLGAGMTVAQSWVSSADTVSVTVGNFKLVAATDPGATTFVCTIMGP